MNSLPEGYRAVVLGATGGLGSAFVEHLKGDPRCGAVLGYSRSSDPRLDLTDPISLRDVADHAGAAGPIHLLIIATGVLKTDTSTPEKALKQLSLSAMRELYEVNAAGPMAALTAFLPHLARQERALVGILSAKVGSISDNRLGGWHSYRMSKAALNMGIKGASIELARTHKKLVLLALHPGTVATQLSDPFAGDRNRLTAQSSSAQLLDVLNRADMEASGSLVTYGGETVSF